MTPPQPRLFDRAFHRRFALLRRPPRGAQRRPRLPPVVVAALSGASLLAPLLACRPASQSSSGASVTPRRMADAVHAVLEADRAVYTQQVVNRLQNELGVLQATEHWKQERTLPLPAQMFRMGAELASQKLPGLHFALLSPWPVNRQNQPRTDAEKAGLDFVVEHPDQNYYGSERLGDESYFTAVYPDKAVAKACVDCHNQHRDSPRRDFELGDVMGGVVVRIREGS